jgi:hypothetical protein
MFNYYFKIICFGSEGRSYETASELLTRIKSRRETIKVPTSGHRCRVHKRQLQ